jgi:mono/diheme cytochrome c family protein
MRKASALAALGVLAMAAPLLFAAEHSFDDSDQQKFAEIEHGRYLATLADCTACHTKKNGDQPFAGGRPIETPFGIIVSANITPDRETGIGNWTDEQFDAAVRRGIRADGSRLFPAMPYTSFTKMTRNDVKAIRAYLSTIPPVHNPVVGNQLPFPLNLRFNMRVWDALFFREGEFKPDPNKSPEWNRGAFLVNGPGHCGACHTPKNLLGADKTSAALHGGQIQGWFAPNITNDEVRGLGAMSVDDIAALLKTGHNRVATVTGPMGEEVEDASAHFTDDDLKAIATYLKSLPGDGDKETALNQSDPRMAAGKAIYRDVCSACHGLDGNGVANLFPALAKAPAVRSADPTSAIRVILRGARSVATASEPTAPAMPSYGWQLQDGQVAAVVTYIRNNWGTAAAPVSAETVAKERSKLADRSD